MNDSEKDRERDTWQPLSQGFYFEIVKALEPRLDAPNSKIPFALSWTVLVHKFSSPTLLRNPIHYSPPLQRINQSLLHDHTLVPNRFSQWLWLFFITPNCYKSIIASTFCWYPSQIEWVLRQFLIMVSMLKWSLHNQDGGPIRAASRFLLF